MTKTTNKQYFEMIAEMVAGNEELSAFVAKQIAILDKKAAYNKEHPSARKLKTAQNTPLAEQIVAAMEEEVEYRAKDILEIFPDFGSTQKVTALLKVAINLGLVEKIATSKATFYRVIPAGEAVEDTEDAAK